MVRPELEVVLLALRDASTQGRKFRGCEAFRAYLTDEFGLGDKFVSKLSDRDLSDCLLQHFSGEAPPSAPTPPNSTSPKDRDESVADESVEHVEQRPTVDPSEPILLVKTSIPPHGSLETFKAVRCLERCNFIEDRTVQDWELEVVDGAVILAFQVIGEEKMMRGRFNVVPESEIPTNLALGTDYKEPMRKEERSHRSAAWGEHPEEGINGDEMIQRPNSMRLSMGYHASGYAETSGTGTQMVANILLEMRDEHDRKRRVAMSQVENPECYEPGTKRRRTFNQDR